MSKQVILYVDCDGPRCNQNESAVLSLTNGGYQDQDPTWLPDGWTEREAADGFAEHFCPGCSLATTMVDLAQAAMNHLAED